jgi:hypothetical protein
VDVDLEARTPERRRQVDEDRGWCAGLDDQIGAPRRAAAGDGARDIDRRPESACSWSRASAT